MIRANVKPPQDSIVAAALSRGFPLLRFEPQLEAEYQSEYYSEVRGRVRFAVCLALLTVLGFAVMDTWMLGLEATDLQERMRFTVHIPIVLLCLVLTSKSFFPKYYLPVISVVAPLFGIGSVMMLMDMATEHRGLLASRLVLVAFFFYFMLGLSFRTALASNMIVLGSFILLAVSNSFPQSAAVYIFYVLVCANLFAGAGCYALEHANRLTFLERRLLNEVATRDSLTGLLNRGAFEAEQALAWSTADRRGRSLAVVMLDIDHFKNYNDRYGHQAGDQCLRLVAQAVRRAASRTGDIVGRYGGEEMIVLLQDADTDQSGRVADNIVTAVRALGIPHGSSPTAATVTVSVGVAAVQSGSRESFEAAVRRADAALYQAKDAGRDRWLLADLSGESLDNVIRLNQARR